MGVTGLWDILESVGHPINIQGLEGKVLGVDANIWLYKFIRGFREKDNATYSIEGHKLGLYNRICKLLFYRIKPVFVFDGPAPILKRRTLEKRQNFRNKHLSKVQDAAMKVLADQLKSQYPNANVDELKINLPELKSNYLVAAEKMTEEDDELFYLPPHIRNEDLASSDTDEIFSGKEDNDDDDDVREIYGTDRPYGNTKVDIHSDDFKQLPAEVRYELLQDVKEASKRIRNTGLLPDDAGTFSSFQLQRLKVRRQIQEKIDECQKDICANFAGELSDGNMVKAFRVQSDATATLLFRSKPSEDEIKPFVNGAEGRSSYKSSQSEECQISTTQQSTNESQSPTKSYRPSLKLLFAEKKPDANYIKLPGTHRFSSKNSSHKNVIERSPILSPEHDDDDSKLSSSSCEKPEQVGKDQQSFRLSSSSEGSTIVGEASEQGDESSSSSDSSELESVILEENDSVNDESTQSIEQNNEMPTNSQSTTIAGNLNANITIDLETPKDERKSKLVGREHSIVDLTESIISSDEGEDFKSINLEPPTKKANVTIDISDDEKETDQVEHIVEKVSSTASEAKQNSSLHEPQPVIGMQEKQTDSSESSKINKEQHKLNESISISQPTTSGRELISESSALNHNQKATTTISSSQPIPSSSNELETSSKTTANNLAFNKSAAAAAATATIKDAAINAQRVTNKVTTKIIEDAKELLRLFGIPYIDAAGEAEAQCALLEELKLTEGTITDDSDIWLFGAQHVYRYFFSDDKYVMQYKMNEINFQLGMTRDYLICFAMLVGSDYTDGIMNVGPVTAIEILSEFDGDGLEPLIKFHDWFKEVQKDKTLIGSKKRKNFLKFKLPEEFPSRAVYDGYLRPVADASNEKFTWGSPNLDELRDYATRNFNWDQKKIDEKLLPVFKKLNEKKLQRTIDTFFFATQANRNPELFRSKRVNQALNKISNRRARGSKRTAVGSNRGPAAAAAAAAAEAGVNLSEDDGDEDD